MRLVDALRGLDARSFERLCRRRGVVVDERQRLSPVEQAARQLADWARVAGTADLPEPAMRALAFLMTHGEGADRADLGGGVLPLMERDLVFAVPEHADRVAMPAAYRAQLAPFAGEDRASLRALLAVQPEEVWTVLGTQLLGRRPVGPAPLWLGELLERLESADGLHAVLAELSPKQRRLLEATEARGGQLETDELLDLEQSPSRVRVAGGAAFPPRSASQQLFARGLLLPRSRGLWVVPTEVADRVGQARRAAEREVRRELLAKVARDEDLTPARAELCDDPGALAVALLVALDRADALPGGGRAVRRSALERAATLVGSEPERSRLLVALARASGAQLERSPLGEVGAVLFGTWRGSGAWDESLIDPDVRRAPETSAHQATPTRGLREVVLELLLAMPNDRFAPVDELVRTASRDLRNAGAARLLERCRQRDPDRFHHDPVAVLRAMVDVALPALGAADRGIVDGREVVRLSARARRWLSRDEGPVREGSRWEGGGRLRVGASTRVASILVAARAAHAIATGGTLLLRFDEESARGALERKAPLSEVREQLEALAHPIDPAAERALLAAERAFVAIRRVAVSSYLPIEDPELRQRIVDDAELRSFVVARSPSEGLLVKAGVPVAELERALVRLGVTLDGDDESA